MERALERKMANPCQRPFHGYPNIMLYLAIMARPVERFVIIRGVARALQFMQTFLVKKRKHQVWFLLLIGEFYDILEG